MRRSTDALPWALDEEQAAWFELLTGIRIDLAAQRHICPTWILHERSCRAGRCRERERGYSGAFDHPVLGTDASGNPCALSAPYRLGSDEVRQLDEWCERHAATWEVVPAPYWGVATITVVIRRARADGRAWRHFLLSDLPQLEEHHEGRSFW